MKRELPTTRDFKLMHITIKATGKGHASDQWIFNNKNKRKLYSELKRFLKLFDGIKLISFVIMSNHAHIILRIMPKANYFRSDVAKRFHQCYPKRKIHPNSHACFKLIQDQSNISAFMQRFTRDFACKFNAIQPFKRTGHLWQGAFHNSNLNDKTALIKCWIYGIFNPTKAKMIDNPLSYRFSSMNCDDSELMEEALQNFFELYKFLDGNEDLTIEEFKRMLENLLKAELERWNAMTEIEHEEYRKAHRFWDKAHYIDKPFFPD